MEESQRPPPDHRSHLLTAKMAVPQVRTSIVRRERLLRKLSQGVEGPLTAVIAPAGAGKSVLAASWVGAGRAPGPVAWVTLDQFDDDPGVFWAYVTAALRRAGAALPEGVGEPIRAEDVDRIFLVRLAGALATLPHPVVLALDEFEHLSQSSILNGLEFVLRNSTPVLRLVVLSRTDTFPALHRFHLQGQAVVLGQGDLAFTPDEAAQLLHEHDVRMSAPALNALIEQTRGWAAALRLCAVAVQRGADPDAFIAALPAADATLVNYLTEEVVNTQPPEVRDFLQRTSVVDRICPALADALTDRVDSDTMLTSLQIGNVLIDPLPETPTWFRYHPVFAHVLRAGLRRDHPELVADLHRRASDWLAGAGLVVDAVRHAVTAGDWQRATAVLVRGLSIGRMLAGREAARLSTMFAVLPPEEPGAMPAVVHAARAMVRFDAAECRASLRTAEKLSDDETDGDRAAVLASVSVISAVLARTLGDLATAQAARASAEIHLARLPDRDAEHPEMRALLLSSVGSTELWAGRFTDAERTLREGLTVSRRPACEYPRLNILGRLAFVEYRKGNLSRAAQLGEKVMAATERYGLPIRYDTGAGHLVLAIVAVERDDQVAARRHLSAAEKSVGARKDPLVAAIAPMLRAWLFAGSRDFRRAITTLDRIPSSINGSPLPQWLAVRIALARAAVHLSHNDVTNARAVLEGVNQRGAEWHVATAAVALATGDRAAARELLRPVLAGELPAVLVSTIDGWVLAARLDADDGRILAARDCLRAALKLAAPEGRKRPFAQSGAWVADLLRAFPELAVEHRWLGPPFVGPEVAASPRPSPDVSPPLGQLTDREHDVLACLARGLSIEDVAAELHLSINTIKTHQKGLYRKLGVARRNDAVRRARERNLI